MPGHPCFIPDKQAPEDRRSPEEPQGPQGPARTPAYRQGDNQRAEGQKQQAGPREVEAPGPGRPGFFGQESGTYCHPGTDHRIGPVDRLPSQTEGMEGHQYPTPQVCQDPGGPKGGRQEPEGPGPVFRRKLDLDQGDHLGDKQGRRHPLEDPGGDEGSGIRRKGGQGRCDGEPGHPGHKHPPAAVKIAQPGPGDQKDRIDPREDRSRQLGLDRIGPEGRPDRREQKADDEEIQDGQRRPGQQKRQGRPPAGRGG